MRTHHSNISVFIVSFFITLSLSYVLQHQGIKTYSYIYLLFFIIEFICIKKQLERTSWPRLVNWFGFFLTASILVGTILCSETMLTVFNLSIALVASIGGSIIINFFLPQINSFFQGSFSHSAILFEKKDRKIFCLYVFLFFIAWFPVFLAYYPGLFTYDFRSQISQSHGSYTAHHPLAHTLLLKAFYLLGQILGSHTFGMALYTLIQMLLLAISFAYLMLFLYRISLKWQTQSIIFIFLAFAPFCSIMSISMTKDTIFTVFFLNICVWLGYISFKPSLIKQRWFQIYAIFNIVGLWLFRNNGMYILIIIGFAGTIYYKNIRKIYFKLLVFSCLLALLFNNSLTWTCQAQSVSSNEMLSVPYQQIANVYSYEADQLSPSTKSQIETILPNVSSYNKHKSDEVKGSGTAHNDWKGFIKLYLSLFFDYPIHYIEGFLLNTQGYWYIDDISFSQMYGFGPGSRLGYMPTDPHEGFDVYHISHFKALENLYEALFSSNLYQCIPVLAVLLSPAFYFWIVIYSFFYMLQNKLRLCAMPAILVASLLLTVLAGPCVLIRYAFPYIVCVPLLLTLTFGSVRQEI